jgi:hypothetical protein
LPILDGNETKFETRLKWGEGLHCSDVALHQSRKRLARERATGEIAASSLYVWNILAQQRPLFH